MTQAEPGARTRVRFRAGAAEVITGGTPIRLDLVASCALGCLAIAGAVPRARLAALLWPDREAARARANLRQLVYRIRRHGALVDGDPLRLCAHVTIEGAWGTAADASPPGASPDPDERRTIGTGEEDAFELPDASNFPELDEWFTAERERRRAATLARAEEAWRSARAAGRPQDAVTAALWRLAADPRSEEAYRDLMVTQLEGGDAPGAGRTFERLRAMLARSFDATPAPESVALAERAARSAASHRPPAHRPGGMDAVGRVAVPAEEEAGSTAPVRGRELVDLAWEEHGAGRSDLAEGLARDAVRLLASEGGDADAWFLLGSIARHRGQEHRARAHFERALARTRGPEDPAGRTALHLNLALVADALDEPDVAHRHYLVALEGARSRGDRATEATVLNNLAHRLLETGRAAEAAVLLRRARERADGLDEPLLRAHVLDGLARAEAALGRGQEARALASLAFETARAAGNLVLQVESLSTLARIRHALEGGTVGRLLAREALRLARRHGYLPGMHEAALTLALVLGSTDPVRALLLEALATDPRVPGALRARLPVAAGAPVAPDGSVDLAAAIERALR